MKMFLPYSVFTEIMAQEFPQIDIINDPSHRYKHYQLYIIWLNIFETGPWSAASGFVSITQIVTRQGEVMAKACYTSYQTCLDAML